MNTLIADSNLRTSDPNSDFEYSRPSILRKIIWCSIVIATGLYICGPIVDPDLWWHITVGKWILAHLKIPHVDYWNMFGAGKPWRAYSWSSEVVLALVDRLWGVPGLLILKMALAILLSFSLFYCLGRLARDWFFGGLLGMYATASCFNHYTLRPQSLIWIFLIWLIYTADLTARAGLNKKRALSFFAIMLVWANTHLTVALGICVTVGWIWQRGRTASATRAALIGFLGTLCTPYFGGEWFTFFAKSGHPLSYNAISEFQPATILQYSTAFLVVLAFLCGVFLHHRPQALPFVRLMVGLGVVLAALAVVKFIPWAVIYLCACTAGIWADAERQRRSLGGVAQGVEKLRKFFMWLPEAGLAFVFLCAAFVSMYRLWRDPLDRRHIPVAAVDFIIDKQLPHPILNEFGKGGYLMYRFSDAKGELEHRVPLDGRTNVNEPLVYEKFIKAFRGKEDWREYIDLVKPGTILWNSGSAFTSLLVADGQWCEVFRSGPKDDAHVVFVRREYWEQHHSSLESSNCKTLPRGALPTKTQPERGA